VKHLAAALVLTVGCAQASGQPSKEVTKTCVKAQSTSASVTYADIPVTRIDETEDEATGTTQTTIRYGREEMGTWETSSPGSFGIVYNGKQILLDRVIRLSKEAPAQFQTSLARWGVVKTGNKSYICITFNFEGLGQSGSFQNIRGIYLIDRKSHPERPFYTVGRVTDNGVTLAK
jgi:hypothetical protein